MNKTFRVKARVQAEDIGFTMQTYIWDQPDAESAGKRLISDFTNWYLSGKGSNYGPPEIDIVESVEATGGVMTPAGMMYPQP